MVFWYLTSRGVLVTSRGVTVTSRGVTVTSRGFVMTSVLGVIMTTNCLDEFISSFVYSFLLEYSSTRLKLGREDLRLWNMLPNHKLILLDETEDKTLDSLGLQHSNNILIEVSC